MWQGLKVFLINTLAVPNEKKVIKRWKVVHLEEYLSLEQSQVSDSAFLTGKTYVIYLHFLIQ